MSARGWRRTTQAHSTRGLLFAGDLVAVVAATVLVDGVTERSAALGAATLFVLLVCREHRDRLVFDLLAELPRLVLRLLLPLLAVAIATMDQGLVDPLARQAVGTAAAVLGIRWCVYRFIRGQRRRNGRFTRATVVLGAGTVGVELVHLLQDHPEYGLAPSGVVDDLPVGSSSTPGLLGSTFELRAVLQRHAVSHVIVAFGPTGEHSLVKVIRDAILEGVDVHVVPRFFEIGLAPRSDAEFLSGIPLYQVRQTALRKRGFRAKRAIDITVSATAIVLLSPVMCTIAIAVALTSAGPILFRQPRVGQNGKVFNVLKFRTLQVQASSHVTWSPAEMDGRTPIGRWLRRLSLDELPQLFNILRGDMSIVGPRPERVFFVDQFEPIVRGYADRHRLPVGLTGLAQVNGLRGDTSIEMRARFDNYYIEHWSPWLDVMIMLRTGREVLRSAINNLDGAPPSAPPTADERRRPDAECASDEPSTMGSSTSPTQCDVAADQAAGGAPPGSR